ncbi:MAG: adenylate/guanylate cyclase domain-containing protein, partial [Candidatus Binatia bacterium]
MILALRAAAVVWIPAKRSVSAMRCSKCGFDSPEGLGFCGQCGARLASVCPSCHEPNPPSFRFCGRCGTALGEASPERPSAEPTSDPRSYTPPHLAARILTGRSALEGERKQVTVLFADVAGFTSLSTRLDPEELHTIMDGCFQRVLEAVHRYEGTVNQFTGDGVMALFGAPIAHEDHAIRAAAAALAVQAALRPYAESLRAERGLEFAMRIGLNTGQVVVGRIGDDLRMDYT